MNEEQIRAALAAARAELKETYVPEDRTKLEGEIAAGEKALKDLQGRIPAGTNSGENGAGAPRQETDQEELTRLRNAENERKMREALQGYADQVAQGAKSRQDAEQVRQGQIFQDMINASLAKFGLSNDGGLAGAVRQVITETRSGAKNRPDEVSEHAQTGYRDPGSANVIRGRGEKATSSSFILAVGRKCLGMGSEQEIGQIQYAMGMKAYFNLTEGAGATSAISGPAGGYLVPPEFNTQLIEGIYPFLVLRSAGVQVIPMKSAQYNQPRLSAQMTATYVGETQPIPTSVEGFTQFNLTAHKLTGLVPMSRELVADSDPSVEMIVREDMARQLGTAEDKAFLIGTGPSFNQPQGILTAAAGATIIAGTASTGDAVTYNAIVDIRTTLNKSNIPEVRRIWVTTPDLLGTLAKVQNPTSGNYVFVENVYNIQGSNVAPGMPSGVPGGAAKPSGYLLGYPVYTSTQLPTPFATNGSSVTSNLSLVETSQVRIGQRGDIELQAFDQATFVDGGGALNSAVQDDMIVFRALMRHDIALRHTGAVVVRTLFDV